MLLWQRQAVVLKGENIALDGLSDVGNGDLSALALGYTTRKARALGHPEAVFARIDDDLSHKAEVIQGVEKFKKTGEKTP